MPGPAPAKTAAVLRVAERLRSISDHLADALALHPSVFLAFASVAYFVTTVYRAQRKLFWFDELFTFYISQLPDLRSMWTACKSGVDFNPPLLYLLTHWSQAIFGATALGTRTPEVVGFWVFCLCLYRFVSIRSGVLAGFIALLFPLTAGGYWYAYDARSHGLVLGFFGVALICWQALADGTAHRRAMLAGLTASLICAALCHAYAILLFIPLGVAELTRTFQRRRLDLLVWTAILLALAVSAATVLPLLEAVQGAQIKIAFAFRPQVLVNNWDLFVDPRLALGVMLLFSAQSLVPRIPLSDKGNGSETVKAYRGHEIAAIAGLLSIPVLAFLTATFLRLHDYERYSLVALAGVACVVGAGCSRSRAMSLAVLFMSIFFIAEGFAGFCLGNAVTEPSAKLQIGSRSAEASFGFESIRTSATGADPVVLVDNLEFAPMFYYAPASIRSRLVNVIQGINGEGYLRLQRCCGAPGTVTSSAAFLSAHRSFFVYGRPERVALWAAAFPREGNQITVQNCGNRRCLLRVVLRSSQSGVAETPAATNGSPTHEQF